MLTLPSKLCRASKVSGRIVEEPTLDRRVGSISPVFISTCRIWVLRTFSLSDCLSLKSSCVRCAAMSA